MLDFFRNHKRLMMFMLILVIVPGLGFVGIQGFRGFFDESANVASVNGRKITRVEYDGTLRQQVDQARQILGAQFDMKAIDTPERRRDILDGLIQQRVLADEAQREHLTAPDEAVRRALLANPVISSLRKPDGSIDVDRYKQMLAMQGMTPEQYDEGMRYGLSIAQIPNSIQSSAFTPKSLAQHLADVATQQRVVQGLILHASDFASKVQPTDAQLASYYDSHRNDFATPETATIQYLVLSPATLDAALKPTDADLKKYYEDNLARYQTPPQMRASLILIATPQSASADDKAKAKQKAEALRAEVKAHPDQFSKIAEQNSQDPLTAAKGGDLGYFGPNMMAGGAAFDDAAFKLKKDEISNVVETDVGYLILKATDVKPSATKPFDEVKNDIAKDLKAQLATKAFADDSDAFTSSVYEQAKSLQSAADKFKLPIQTAVVTPKPNTALQPDSPLNNAKFLAAVFASDSVKDRNNTQAIDVGNSTLISARVTDYKPAAVPALDAIKGVVRQKFIAEQSAELARKVGAEQLAALQKSKSTVSFSPEMKLSRNDAQGVPLPVLNAVFKADAQKLPAYVGVDVGADGYAIFRVNIVLPGAPIDAQRLAAAQQQIAESNAQSEMQAYIEALRARSKVKLYGNIDTPQTSGE